VAAVAPTEITSVHVEEALSVLSDLIGETTPEETLDEVFAAFCIGK
jgi:tRNA U34 5-carboxymethylaminomethyl modifying GTPase MnmE/TrmE